MFDLGDKLTVEGYRIPRLIWIQILVFFLLIFLFFRFSFFPSDLSDTTASSSSASPSALGVFMPLNSHLDKQTLTDSSIRTGEEEEEEGKVGISTRKTKQHRFVKSVYIYVGSHPVMPGHSGLSGSKRPRLYRVFRVYPVKCNSSLYPCKTRLKSRVNWILGQSDRLAGYYYNAIRITKTTTYISQVN